MDNSSQVQAGKRFVEATLFEMAAELELSLSDLAWARRTGDFDGFVQSLVFRTADGTRHILKFHLENLEDSVGDIRVKEAIRAEMRKRLKKLIPRSPRIGF